MVQFSGVISLRYRVLPKVSSNSGGLRASLGLTRTTITSNIARVLTAPRRLSGSCIGRGSSIVGIYSSFRARLSGESVPLAIFPNRRIRVGNSLIRHCSSLLNVSRRGHCVLLRFPRNSIPNCTRRLVFNLGHGKAVPMVIRPREGGGVRSGLSVLCSFVSGNTLTRIATADCIKNFNRRITRVSRSVIRRGLIRIITSSTRDLPNEGFILDRTLCRVTRSFKRRGTLRFRDGTRGLVGNSCIATHSCSPVGGGGEFLFFWV